MSRARVWLRWTNLVLIGITLIAYSAPLVSPEHGWLPGLLALFFPWLLLANLLCIVAWAFLKSRYAFFSLGCLILGWGHVSSFVGFHGSAKLPDDGSVKLRVATLNLHNMVDWETRKRWLTPDDLLKVIGESGADVFCFQEFDKVKGKDYAELLTAQSPLKYKYKNNHSLLVLSKYPIETGRETMFENRSNGFQEVDFIVEGQKVRLFNLHLQTNGISRDLEEWMGDQSHVERSGVPGRVGSLFKSYWHGAKLRAKQAEQVAEAVANSEYPVIVCGDFNDVPLSWAYRRLTRDLTDGFKVRGSGLGTTYSGNIPALRIDYILTQPSIKVLSYKHGSAPFSDHKSVWSDLALPPAR